MALSLLAAIAVGVSPAAAALPPVHVTVVSSPAAGSWTNNAQPVFSGTTDNFDPELETPGQATLSLYPGRAVEGVPSTITGTVIGGEWLLAQPQPLADGTYTAVAEVVYEKIRSKSEPVTFTVDTTAPNVTLQTPVGESAATGASQAVAGGAGTAEGDANAVTVQLYAGRGTDPGAYRQSLVVPVSNGSWSGTLGGLTPGTYTLFAEQSDAAGNRARTAAVPFTINLPAAPAPHPPPVASFTWFPSAPTTGQSVTLVSSSTDAVSPITGFAWAPAGGQFHGGGPVVVTSFATPGEHVMRLRVTAADGLSTIATATIHVTRPVLPPMQPFPIIRIAGVQISGGVNLSSLAAQAPRGALVTVTCRGRGCPARSERRLATASRKRPKSSTVEIAFRRFQRSLRAGVVLEVRVSKPGMIGKYTRFSIRRSKLPVRVDQCLASVEPAPIRCPS
jgi:hypothetical protein